MSRASFGTRLRAARETRGWTQGELAKRAKVSRPYIVQLENGTREDCSIRVLRQLAKTLGVTADKLLG
jgi:transcriptional regulator with XRE-family HTH domain